MDLQGFVDAMPQNIRIAYETMGVVPPCTKQHMENTKAFLEGAISRGPDHHDDKTQLEIHRIRKAFTLLCTNEQDAFLPPLSSAPTSGTFEPFICDTQGRPCRMLPHIWELNLEHTPPPTPDSGLQDSQRSAEEASRKAKEVYLANYAIWTAAFDGNKSKSTLSDFVQVADVRNGLQLPPPIPKTRHESTKTYKHFLTDLRLEKEAYIAAGMELAVEKDNMTFEMHQVHKQADAFKKAALELSRFQATRPTAARAGTQATSSEIQVLIHDPDLLARMRSLAHDHNTFMSRFLPKPNAASTVRTSEPETADREHRNHPGAHAEAQKVTSIASTKLGSRRVAAMVPIDDPRIAENRAHDQSCAALGSREDTISQPAQRRVAVRDLQLRFADRDA